MKSERNLQAQLKTAQANIRPKFLIEFASLLPDKNYFLKFPSLLKFFKTATAQPTQKHSDSWLQNSILTRVARHGRQERQGIIAPIRNWRFSD